MPRESGIEKGTCKALEAALPGVMCVKLGHEGWPDRVVFLPDRQCFFIEFKAPGESLRSDQKLRAEQLLRARHVVLVIDSRQDGRYLASEVRTWGLAGAAAMELRHAPTIRALRSPAPRG